MLRYIARRLLALPVVLLLVTLVLFVLMWQLPLEQRAMLYMPSIKAHPTEAELARLTEQIIERHGLDRPAPVQYLAWLRNLARGQWGYSPTWRQNVLEGLLRRAPATLELALAAMIPAVGLALWLGPLAARYRHHLPDQAIRLAASVAWAFPAFILGLLLMNLFYARLGWFPPERWSIWAGQAVRAEPFRWYTGLYGLDALLNGRLDLAVDALRHLVLPAATLAVAQWALLTRVLRAAMLEALSQDYVSTARAKGLPERQIVRRHAQRNALLPLISTGGVAVSLLITGTVLVELVFSYPGVGRGAVQAILATDVPVAVGFALFAGLVTILASLLADVLYAVADPRLRLY